MATTGYRHGIYTSEQATSILPARTVDSAVVFAVGTAPVHTLAGDKARPVNVPQLFYSYDEAVQAMGWDADHFSDYSLQELIYSHFAIYRGAPVVCVNVFDPEKHKTEVADESLTFGTSALDKDIARLAHGGVCAVELKDELGETTYEAGTDYSVDAVSGLLTRLAEGSIPEGGTVKAGYVYADVSKVTSEDVIGGIDPASTEKAVAFYSQFVEGQLHRTNAKTAEMCKLTENSSRDVQIAFANELSLICDKAGINVWELIELANKHPRVHILQPGSGVGGHCIAVDPYFITSEFPVESQLIAKSREINNYKAFWCAERIREAVRGFKVREGRPPRVALMGLAFKPDIDDLRESPAKYIVSKVMEAEDADYMIVEPNVREHRVYKLTDYAEAYAQADIVAFLVAHAPFRSLAYRDDAVILDFCGIFRK